MAPQNELNKEGIECVTPHREIFQHCHKYKAGVHKYGKQEPLVDFSAGNLECQHYPHSNSTVDKSDS